MARDTAECMESRICQLLLKNSEAVLEQEDSSIAVQCFSYSIAALVPLVFNTQLINSRLHAFAKSFANQLVGVTILIISNSVCAGPMCML